MKLGKQLYSVDESEADESKPISLAYTPEYDTALNLTGYLWSDHKYSFVKNLLVSNPYRHRILVTDTDLLAHDDYMQAMLPNVHLIVFVLSPVGEMFNGQKTCGASKKRLKQAIAKLNRAGFTTKFFVNKDAANRFIAKQDADKLSKKDLDKFSVKLKLLRA